MKKLKKAFVFILTIALVLTNIPLSVFADSAAETGLLKTTEKNEITIPMIHSVAMLPIGDESFTEHFVSVFFFISGKDLEPQRIKVKVDKDEQEQDEIQQTLKTGKMGTSISANIRFPLNDTDIPQNYKVYFYIDDSNKIDESKSVNVVIPNKKVGVAPAPDPGDPSDPKPIIPPPTAADHSILRVSEENFSLSEKGGEVSFDLFTSRGTPLEKVRVSILLNGNPFEPKENDLQITGEKAKKSVKLMIPENTTDQEQVYILKFNATGSATDFQDLPIVTIKVAPQENIIPKIDGFMIITPNLPKEGGKTTITVKGTDLTKENIIIKIWKIVGEDHLEQKELSNNVKFDGEGKTYSATLTFPPSGNAADRYLIKAGTAEDKMTHEGVVTVGENTSGEIIVLQPTSIYINSKGSQITLRFDEPIFAVKDIEDVKNGISLDIDGDKVFEKLDPQDKVEMIDNLLLISLDKAIETNTNSKIRLEERILKDSRSREGKRNEYFIQRSVPMIFKAEFLEGEKLDHNGGRVRIRFTGENLLKTVGDKELKPIVQVLELQAKSSDQKVIENTNERSTDTEQIFSFIAPENKTSRARSYMVR
ncbi:MAG: hypothetical protein Q4A75_08095, partial [Peptostreptococcaceae bacterium]|nr:hypothetical protein [Peptostreptococcaceae bacterium]